MQKQTLKIPDIKLEWSEWIEWKELEKNTKDDGPRVPREPGVYEVRSRGSQQFLIVGKASNLMMRVRQGLVRGLVPYAARDKLIKNENIQKIEIRWAITDRPSATEEELHKKYKKKFGELPKYTKHT